MRPVTVLNSLLLCLISVAFSGCGLAFFAPPSAGETQTTGMQNGTATMLTVLQGVSTPFDLPVEGFSNALTIKIEKAPSHGTATLVGTSRVTYVSESGYTGSDEFTYSVTDGSQPKVLRTVTITVNAGTILANNLSLLTSEGKAVSFSLMASTTSPVPVTYAITKKPEHGQITLAGNQGSYQPDGQYHGLDSFTYSASDGKNSSTGAVTVTISNSSGPLVSNPEITVHTFRNSALTISLPVSDADGDVLQLNLVTQPSHGTVTAQGTVLTYTPANNWIGADRITYTVTDGTNTSPTGAVTVNTNANVTALGQDLTLAENATLAINLISAGGVGNVTYSVSSQPLHGSVSLSDTTATYRPNDNYHGNDAFHFRVSDDSGNTSEAAINLTVTNSVGPTVAQTSYSLSTVLNKSASLQLTITDPDGDAVSITGVTAPAHGKLTFAGLQLTFVPDADFVGGDRASFRVTDGTNISDVIGLNLLVTAPLVLSPLPSVSVAENTQTTISLAAQGGQGSLVYSVSAPSHGTATVKSNVVTYTPTANFHGNDSVAFSVTDGTTTASGSVSIVVQNTVGPVLGQTSRSVSVSPNTPATFTISASDSDGDPISLRILQNPAHGTLALNGLTITYSPTKDYTGSDVVTYQVTDGTNNSATGTINFSVASVPPTAASLTFAVTSRAPTLLKLVGTSPSGNPLTYEISTPPHWGQLGAVSGDTVTYTSVAGYIGGDSLIYRVYDGYNYSGFATVTFTITAPSVVTVYDFSQSTTAYSSITVGLQAISPTKAALNYEIVTSPKHGQLINLIGASYYYTPADGYVGTDTFTYRAFDLSGYSQTTATGTITIGPARPPSADSLTVTTTDGGSAAVTLKGYGVSYSAPVTFSVVSGPSHGAFTITKGATTPGTYTYTPTPLYVGSDLITYTTYDSLTKLTSAPAKITITVVEALVSPRHPIYPVYQNKMQSIALTANYSGSAPLTYKVMTQPAHGTLAGESPNLQYTPAKDYVGSDTFTFQVTERNNVTTTDANLRVTAPIVITTTADSGPGSLRSIMQVNNDLTAGNIVLPITFNVEGGGKQIFTPASPLPAVPAGFSLDGSTQPGWSGAPLIGFDLRMAGGYHAGIGLYGPGSGINALAVYNGGTVSTLVFCSDNTFITRSFIGLGLDGKFVGDAFGPPIYFQGSNILVTTSSISGGEGSYLQVGTTPNAHDNVLKYNLFGIQSISFYSSGELSNNTLNGAAVNVFNNAAVIIRGNN